jgi:hypothetical protein
MSNPAINDPEIRNLVRRIMKLQRQLEKTASSVEKPGFIPNRFGAYDKADLTDEIFREFSELLEKAPSEEYFRFLFAGALARANRLLDAESEYCAIKEANGGYAEAATLLLAGVRLQSGKKVEAESALADYNNRVVSRGMLPLTRSLQDLEIKMP